MNDIVSLGIGVDSSGVVKGVVDLDKLDAAAGRAEKGVRDLEAATRSSSASHRAVGQAAAIASGNMDAIHSASTRAVQSSRNLAAQTNATTMQMRALALQMPDVVSGVLSGQGAFQLLVQQGGQVYQQFQMTPGGVGGALRNVGGVLTSMVTPTRVLGGAFVAAAAVATVAWNRFDDQLKVVQQSLNGLGRGTGATSASLIAAASAASASGQQSYSQAIGGASMLAGAGVYDGLIARALIASRTMAGATGTSLSDSQAIIADALKDPSSGIDKLGKQFGLFGLETEKQIRALQAQNRLQEAQAALLSALNQRLKDTTDTTGLLRQGMDWLASKMSAIGASIGKIGAKLAPAEELAAARKDYAMAKLIGNPDVIAEKLAKVQEAQKAVADEAVKAAERQAAAERARQQRLDEQRRQIADVATLDAQAIVARTSAQKLAIEQERIRTAAVYDATKAATVAADAERARTIAMAEATRAMRDFQRSLRDEFRLGGAFTEGERIRRQTEIEFRNIREQTNVLSQQGAGGVAVTSPAVSEAATRLANGFNSIFAARLGQLQDQFPELRMTSGVRSHSEQEALRARYGSGAARPGTSRHEIGLAADFSGRNLTAEQRAAVIAAARSLGLEVIPSNHGAMHVQGPRSWANQIVVKVQKDVANDNAARPLTIGGGKELSESDTITRRLAIAASRYLYEQEAAVTAQSKALQINIETFGKSAEEVARITKQRELENELIARQIPITAEAHRWIERISEAYGRQAKASESALKAQQNTIAQMDELRSAASDAISSPLKALIEGKSPGEAAKQAAMRIGGRAVDGAVNHLVESLLGARGKAGGGLLGSLLGQQMYSANMQVQAATVMINGGVLGGGGPGGLLGGLLGGGSGYGAMESGYPGLYASGGYTGNGGVNSPAGIVHGQEYVVNARATKRFRGLLEAMNAGQLASMPTSGSGATPAAPAPANDRGGGNMFVKVITPPGHTAKTRESTSGNGDRQLEILIDAKVAESLSGGMGRKVLTNDYGLKRVGRA